MPLTPPAHVDTPYIAGHLSGLKTDARTLAGQIHKLVIDYRKAQSILTGWNSAIEELAALTEIEDAIKVAQRKMLAPPKTLKASYWTTAGRNNVWDGITQDFTSTVTPLLARIAEAKSTLEEHREKPGNQGATENPDILIALIKQVLCDAGAKNWRARTGSILAAYCFTALHPSTLSIAASRGALILEGAPLEGSVDGLISLLSR